MTGLEMSGQATAYTYPTVGRRPMKVKPMPFCTRLPAALQDRVREHAALSGVPMNDVVERALELYLARVKVTAPVPRPTIAKKAKPKGGR